MGERIDWQDDFQRISLNDGIPQESSQNDIHFQHRLCQQEDKDDIYSNYDNQVTLRYRDSISSNASTLSRNSTMSSTDTRYFSAMGSPGSPHGILRMSSMTQTPSPVLIPTGKAERPSSLSPIQTQFEHTSSNVVPVSDIQQMIEPTGCFVPMKYLPFVQKTGVTKNHYVIPTFAMAGESQADVMKLLFNNVDHNAFKSKEEYERTIPWHIDNNSSLVTLSQYTCLGPERPVSRNYLLGLGQRLGITSLLVIVSIEVIDTVYPLLDNLIKAMEINEDQHLMQQEQPSWWSRVVLVVNQQHGTSDQAAYNQRKHVLIEEIPKIQERYRLSQPLSVLFLSTQTYNKIKNTSQGVYYQTCCQRILWQMMEKHMLSGRWCNEITAASPNRQNQNSSLNILNEDDESDSSSDDAIFKTVIDYVDGKKKRPSKKKNHVNSTSIDHYNTLSLSTATPTILQRRTTRRQTQKLHCHDGDDGTSLPLPVGHS